MSKRYKKLRINKSMRDLVKDVYLSKEDLIYPVFVTEKENTYEEIKSMPNQFHYSIDKLDILINKLHAARINKIMLFGIPLEKDEYGTQADYENGIIQQAIRHLKNKDSNLFIISDVCLCEYTSHGHCGILDDNKTIDNTKTVERLKSVALSHALAGVDMIAPSDMSDTRIKEIRTHLDQNNFHYLPIMSYSIKMASTFYGPFRQAANSAPSFGDRKYYQMDYCNSSMAMAQIESDINDGADIVIIKPGLAYLDLVYKVKENFNIPVAVYNVSGEYAMIKSASLNNLIDEKGVVMETMYAFKRAKANMIITYHALDVSKWLDE